MQLMLHNGASHLNSASLQVMSAGVQQRQGECPQEASCLWTLIWGNVGAGQVMFDPYAPAVAAVQLQEGYNVVPPREGQNGAAYKNNPPAMMGCLASLLEDFDFGSSQR